VHNNYVVPPSAGYYYFAQVSSRHLETVNTLFMDGHVKAMKKTELEKTAVNTSGRSVVRDSYNGTYAIVFTNSTTINIHPYFGIAATGTSGLALF
jgi:prepilin-type processing-associated H-X9-DG protein